jgi:hypothetical protein
MNKYEKIINEFNTRNCKLLTTKEEHAELLNKSKSNNYKLNYIASCGHNNNVFYNVFKNRNTGIVCSNCKNKKIGEDIKEKIKNNILTKTYKIELEYNYIKKIINILENNFEIKKAFDGCLTDIIFKPKNIIEDKFVGIQVKTTSVRNSTYSFHINNLYENILLLLYCYEDDKLWIIPENIIKNQKKISIGYKKSKYDIYNVNNDNNDNIINKLNTLYNITSKFNYDTLNKPINIYQQREQEYIKYREEKINFIFFESSNMEATVYDFKIGNLKLQEKVAKKNDKKELYIFSMCKHNGCKEKNIQYDIGDNDFYWLNFDNKKTFFVIPEKILIEKGFIGNKNKKILFKINIKNISWIKEYMFDYENIDKDLLLNILNKKNNI